MLQTGRHFFTSESVTEGHPDKIADQISDAVLDAVLRDDPIGRVACETLVTTGLAFIAGEISTKTYVDLPSIVRQTIKEIGYTRAKFGFDYETCAVISSIDPQSRRHRPGRGHRRRRRPGNDVRLRGPRDRGADAPAADARAPARPAALRGAAQGRARLPAPGRQVPGHRRVRGQRARSASRPSSSRPSTPRRSSTPRSRKRSSRRSSAGRFRPALLTPDTKFHINPTGRFVIGGPQGDTGLTGRKIIVDTYGGSAPHGGGAFSGKDPTKVDRSAAYMARYVAKNIVAAGLAERALIQLAYAIGVADPVSVHVETFGTGKLPESRIVALIREHFTLTPEGHHRDAEPAPAHLQGDRGVRPLRPPPARVHLGADRQGRGAREGGRRRGRGAGGRIGDGDRDHRDRQARRQGPRPRGRAARPASSGPTRACRSCARSASASRRRSRCKGVRLSACLHVTSETANLARTLTAGRRRPRALRLEPALDPGRGGRLARRRLRRRGLRRSRARTTRRTTTTSAPRSRTRPNMTMDDGADLVSSLLFLALGRDAEVDPVVRAWAKGALGRRAQGALRRHHRRHRGDDDGRHPPQGDGEGGRPEVPGRRRQRGEDQALLRQPLRHGAVDAGRHHPGDEPAHRRAERRRRRLRLVRPRRRDAGARPRRRRSS